MKFYDRALLVTGVVAMVGSIFFCGFAIAKDDDASEANKRVAPRTFEFVCYEDGKLSERHVGVTSAEEKVSGPAWKLTYAEGGYAIYAQKPGESCQTETTD